MKCWSLDFAHTLAICHTLYALTITSYGDASSLLFLPRSLQVTVLLSGFIGPSSKAGIVGLSTIALRGYPIDEYTRRAGWLIQAIVIVSAAVDGTLVIALCWILSSWKLDRATIARKVVNQIITWTLETGFITILGALGLLVTFLTMRCNFVYIGVFLVIPKLFSNALLLSLNSRDRYAKMMRQRVEAQGLATTTAQELELSNLQLPLASGMNDRPRRVPFGARA
ncbi:Glycoside hydrolase [Mycena kentingensis (nom. inval.)]|nr:Glycoside hydrolase [Mycena kentingensis (nom. inval.)]